MTRYLLSLTTLMFLTGCAQQAGSDGGLAETEPQPMVQDSSPEQSASQDGMVQFESHTDQIVHVEDRSIHRRTRSTTDVDDARLVNEATMLNLTGIVLGQAALQSASSQEVKRLGQEMIDGHKQAQSELTDLCARRGLKVPKELDPLHLNLIGDLNRLSGQNFDKRYVHVMIKEYEKVIAKFEAHVKGGYDPELRAFSARSIPALQQHHRLAMNIQPTLELASK